MNPRWTDSLANCSPIPLVHQSPPPQLVTRPCKQISLWRSFECLMLDLGGEKVDLTMSLQSSSRRGGLLKRKMRRRCNQPARSDDPCPLSRTALALRYIEAGSLHSSIAKSPPADLCYVGQVTVAAYLVIKESFLGSYTLVPAETGLATNTAPARSSRLHVMEHSDEPEPLGLSSDKRTPTRYSGCR